MNESTVKCVNCKYLKIINSDTLYAVCEKTKFEFKPFDVDTRKHSCGFADKKMIKSITREQLNELENARFFYGVESFNFALEKMTGIKAKPYIGYSYYDTSGNYVGDSNETDTEKMLVSAYIKVE